jgi:hypothetical protein
MRAVDREAEERAIRAFIRRHGVRRCPTAFAVSTPQAAHPVSARTGSVVMRRPTLERVPEAKR